MHAQQLHPTSANILSYSTTTSASMPPIAPTPPGVPHYSVYYIVDASQDRSAAGVAGTSVAMRRSTETTPSNQHALVQLKLHAGRCNQFGTPSSFGVGVPTRITPRATREHKGKRLSAPGIGSFYPKPNVALDLFLTFPIHFILLQ